MTNLLIFLFCTLIATVTIECFIGDIYFKDGYRRGYYRILKSIYNILIIIFIFLHRHYIVAVKGLGGILLLGCTLILLINIFYITESTKRLREKNLL
ncbi:hypothetical protein GCM10008905_28400 [Clostridium malenominatum]|uniref:Uncharacterized protein n=1 Tax=Clostridium malenominatum TaxID=1539 RepID=A0ABN1J4Y8_9CLOT